MTTIVRVPPRQYNTPAEFAELKGKCRSWREMMTAENPKVKTAGAAGACCSWGEEQNCDSLFCLENF